MAEKVQVLLFTSYLHDIGGIETFVFQFCEMFADEYTIGVMIRPGRIPEKTRERLSRTVKVYEEGQQVFCDTLVMIRINDKTTPNGVAYNRMIRMVHACKSDPSWRVPQDADEVVHVSEASKRSFESDGIVIHNPLKKDGRKALLLVSATRVPALDKGRNLDRMVILARMLNKEGIPFIWFNFSDNPIPNAPKGMVNVGSFAELQPYIAKADYLVQLSDQEGFCYSLVEALINQTPVIVTPFETTEELHVIDGVNGYVVPFDMNFDVKKLLAIPECPAYKYEQADIKKKWKKALFSKKSKMERVIVCVTHDYFDIALQTHLHTGDEVPMTKARAAIIKERGFGFTKGILQN